MCLGEILQKGLNGDLIDGAEGLPFYFDARPNQHYSYRPSVVLRDDVGSQTYFVISFTHVPKTLMARPSKRSSEVLLHYIDFCRMMRWGVLERPRFREYFEEANAFTPEEADRRLRDFIAAITVIRTDFWNRGLERDALRNVVDPEMLPALDQLYFRYYETLKVLDPDDSGLVPEPLPDYRHVQKAYKDLLELNKSFFLIVHNELGKELSRLEPDPETPRLKDTASDTRNGEGAPVRATQ
jgi:hypothetical protein